MCESGYGYRKWVIPFYKYVKVCKIYAKAVYDNSINNACVEKQSFGNINPFSVIFSVISQLVIYFMLSTTKILILLNSQFTKMNTKLFVLEIL